MTYKEFLDELERQLAGMPEEERQAAVQYYADYFADAGSENEAEVIRELGSPEKAAGAVRADYYGTQFNEEAFEHKDYMEKYRSRAKREHTGGSGYQNTQSAEETVKKPWGDNRIRLLLILLIAVVLWPVTLGIGTAVLGLAIGVVSLFAGLVLAAVIVAGAGAVLLTVGIAILFIPPAAFIVMGAGLLLLVLGMAATVGTVKLCIIVYPAMLRGFVNLCRRPFYGKAVS